MTSGDPQATPRQHRAAPAAARDRAGQAAAGQTDALQTDAVHDRAATAAAALIPTGFLLTAVIGRRLFWEVTAEGIIEVPDAGGAARHLLSFDVHDHRLRTLHPRSARQGRRAFMREWGEQVRLLDAARSLKAQYGRDPRHRIPRPEGLGVIPGLQLVDLLMARAGFAGFPALIGLRLGVQEGRGRSLVLLFAYDADGELLRFQEVANPPSLAYILEDFCRGLPAGLADVSLQWFSQHEILACLPHLRPYPEEDQLLGHPLRLWWQQGNRILQYATLLLCLATAAQSVRAWQAGAEQARLQHTLQAERQALAEALQARVPALAQRGSVQLERVFRDAEALACPSARVRVSARPERVDYALIFDLAQNADPSGAAARSLDPFVSLAEALQSAQQRRLPEGLYPLDAALRGDLHVTYLRYRRQTAMPEILAMLAAGDGRPQP